MGVFNPSNNHQIPTPYISNNSNGVLHFSDKRKCIAIIRWNISLTFHWLITLFTTLLQNVTDIITKCQGVCHKMLQIFLLQNATVITDASILSQKRLVITN